ncbi:OmpP1/FadL family transporter [Ectopseudomonas hydrolytica]|uniref:Membrane protein involved in aromatic hydrocarbon degradation n=2 Tax=Ectopseudomonas TaxID=3236654 RepID=A4XRT7_ECTM1|nr:MULTISPECIES: OmpP1/FadL family transporter [Pseudomonas]ATH83194.1 transporter [Pseudomonas mendocina]MDH0096309.1 OmpP1/FadL family transporter [Pseudomonas sp. GD04158]USR41078.1 OmpP1/FadL family transporter [Pseudomonas hydrolytica]UTH37797.1 OmpP1/FadL family transporter [Pseudomonas sp. KHPS1]
MTMLSRRWPSPLMVGSLLVLPVVQVQASGYHFGSQSVAAQGSAHANGAEAADASTIFYNPAGLARLKGTQLTSGLTILLPDGKYEDKGSRDVFGNPVSGDAGEFLPDAAAAPNFYFSHEINERVTVGLGIFTPFGAKLDYKEDWAGRYGIQSASLETVTFNPSIAFRFNDHHSIGFGVSAQYIKSVQRGAADVKGASRQLAGQFVDANYDSTRNAADPILGPIVGIIAGVPVPEEITSCRGVADRDGFVDCVASNFADNVQGDGYFRVKGDDWGFGWNIGYMWEPTESTRFGVAYRSNIRHTLEGETKWSFAGVQGSVPSPDTSLEGGFTIPILDIYVPPTDALRELFDEGNWVNPGDFAATRLHPNSKAKTAIDTPEMLSFNAFHQLNDKVALMADLTFTRHSRLDEVRIGIDQVAGYPYFNGVTEGDLSVKQDWKDTYKISLGMNYQYSDDLLLRTGVAYDKSPVNSTQLRHPAFPDADRYWLSFGANYKVTRDTSLDFAYSYVQFSSGKMDYQDGCSPAGWVPGSGGLYQDSGVRCTGNGGNFTGEYETRIHFIGLALNHTF